MANDTVMTNVLSGFVEVLSVELSGSFACVILLFLILSMLGHFGSRN